MAIDIQRLSMILSVVVENNELVVLVMRNEYEYFVG